ncbi:glycosyl hydrolase [Aquibacillus rhizosphaerae]|uniref:Glycosyl hydrolase n=1 Tax=Aquibacillus rhizosphaerae TaxID=3051431 RepID=A0ABT7L8V5_9BACI|nr:glycosyl hydrolase [Aquibacillus sp. LR5S19]MDL4842306.1 glycosyl hydrolase [Aquibacillus sp. LR5S19]
MTHSLHQQFLEPSEEFTPIPFWFWNDHLTKQEIIRQIGDFYEKGVTGFVLHPRIGIPKELVYLSDDYMELVHLAVKEAKRLGMTVILYDEAMYPSGSANGLVVKGNPEYASRGLKMVEYACKNTKKISLKLPREEKLVSVQAVKKKSTSEIDLNKSKLLEYHGENIEFVAPDNEDWSIVVFIETFSGGTIRGIHFGEDDGEDHAPTSTDLLNPEAVKKFIQLTHDTYYIKLKDYFGDTVVAMFTDEPDILGRGATPGLKPWTGDFLTFYKQNGNDERDLPALWLEAGEQTVHIRKKYRKTVNQKLTESYYKQISSWCANHHIALTGHPAKSDDIGLLEHFQIPGQDVVWRWVAPEEGKALEGEHSTAGKCSSDAARHRGRRRNLNEFLGVCGKESAWALSPGDMKWYMDWLLVRGVNLLSPHAFYYSIDGSRRSHERPPDVGPNNHWWPYYKFFAQYMKRLSWLMTDSTNQASVAVLCDEDHLPWKIVKPLYENQIEFNYLETSLLKRACSVQDDEISIVNQRYSVVVIEDCKQLDTNLIEKLQTFIDGGGEVIINLASNSASPVKGAKTINHEDEVVEGLPKHLSQEINLFPKNTSIRVSKVIKSDYTFYLFVNEGEEQYEGTFSCQEKGKIERWDAWSGTIKEISLQKQSGNFIVPLKMDRRSSIVFCVDTSGEAMINNNFPIKIHKEELNLTENWHVKAQSTTMENPVLQSWLNWRGLEDYTGTVVYENNFNIERVKSIKKLHLDLGDVYEIANVFINGKHVAVNMWAPYQSEIGASFIQTGINQLRIDVTNSIANKMDEVKMKSGLIGPVTLEIERYIEE